MEEGYLWISYSAWCGPPFTNEPHHENHHHWQGHWMWWTIRNLSVSTRILLIAWTGSHPKFSVQIVLGPWVHTHTHAHRSQSVDYVGTNVGVGWWLAWHWLSTHKTYRRKVTIVPLIRLHFSPISSSWCRCSSSNLCGVERTTAGTTRKGRELGGHWLVRLSWFGNPNPHAVSVHSEEDMCEQTVEW